MMKVIVSAVLYYLDDQYSIHLMFNLKNGRYKSIIISRTADTSVLG